jgi:hypothetical protein
MVEEVTLRCILLDNGPNQPFIVRIRVDESVFDLMEKILKSTENRTREYDAQDILLYKASAFQANLVLCSSTHGS